MFISQAYLHTDALASCKAFSLDAGSQRGARGLYEAYANGTTPRSKSLEWTLHLGVTVGGRGSPVTRSPGLPPHVRLPSVRTWRKNRSNS